MDCEKKINMIEGVPLNSAGAANIFLNAGNNTKVNSPNGTVIHLKSDKSSPADVGLHINTTFSVASSKKIKLLFIVNFLLSVICMVISCTVAFYYWNEITAMRRQLDSFKDQLIIHNLKESSSIQDRVQQSALVSIFKPQNKLAEREPRVIITKDDNSPQPKMYYVEGLGEDILLVDLSKKSLDPEKVPAAASNAANTLQRDILVAHFNGAQRELNLGKKSLIGPWVRDTDTSSKGSESRIELNTDHDYVTVKETGLYLVYAQVVYLSHAPNCYFIWARQPEKEPRLLTTCSTGDDSTGRPLDRSQISCSVHTVARLTKGDIVNLAQREHNRTVWLKPGYSYFGFVKLSS